MKSFLSFIAGAGVGSVATYFIAKKFITEKVNIEANRKINESIKILTEELKNKPSTLSSPNDDTKVKEVNNEVINEEDCVEEKIEEGVMSEDEKQTYFESLGYDNGYDPEEIIDRINGRLNIDGEDKLDDIEDIQSGYFITPAQFEEKNGYEKMYVDFYTEDSTYVNNEDGTLFLISGFAKEDLMDEFEQLGIVSCQCLRNDYLKCDVMIDKVYESNINEDEFDGCIVD